MEAYVLIQTEIGKQPQVLADVQAIPGVIEAKVVTGPYDLVARVEAADVDSLGKLIVTAVQSVSGISRTLTCPVAHL